MSLPTASGSDLTSLSDLWLPISPGIDTATEAALLNPDTPPEATATEDPPILEATQDQAPAIAMNALDASGFGGTADSNINLDAIDSSYHMLGCGCPVCQRGGNGSEPGGLTGNTVGSGSTSSGKPYASLQGLADYLRDGFWQEFGAIPRRYNLASTGPNPNNGVLYYNLSGWNFDTDSNGTLDGDTNGLTTARRNLVREVFKLYEATLGIRFLETTSTSRTLVDFFFTDNYSGAYSYAAGNSSSDGVQYSVINVASSWDSGISSFDSYSLQTFFHEIGHAIGLGHQGLYNGSGSYAVDAKFANDSWQASMMSYFSQTANPTTGASYAFLQSPMSVDWLALDDIYRPAGYGVANAFRGDTIYGVGTNISAATSQIWNQFSTYAGRSAYTIVDGDGYDTLNVSNFSADQLINLAPSLPDSITPSLSNIGGKIGNLSIAVGTVIEAAIGGSGNDSFYGNNANNSFLGGVGNDSFYDSLGSDIYSGEAGIDWLYFTESIELLRYELTSDSLLFSRITGSLDVDQVWNSIDYLVFNSSTFSYDDLVRSLSGPLLPNVTITAVNGLASGAATNSTTLSFSGSLSQALSAGQAIAVYRNGVQVGSTEPSAADPSAWSFSLQESSGTNSISYTARVVDTASGQLGSLSSPFALTVDTDAPLVSVDTLQTQSTTPVLSGTISEAAAQVSVSIGAISRSAVNNGNGTWSLQWIDGLTAGASYDVVATATDAAGNSGIDNTNGELSILVAPPPPPPAPSPILYFTLASAVTSSSASVMGGLTAQRNDIIAFDGSRFSTWLNGNASGLSGAVLSGLHIVSPDEVVVAVQSPVTLSGIAFDDSDLARLSRNTSGGFSVSMFFDGSDVGLTTNAEAIDAVTGLADGSWLISTRGSGSVPGVASFAAEDILRFRPTSLGANTAGSWSLQTDMSDVGISGTAENVTALSTAADGRLFLTTSGNASATGLSATNEDVFTFRPTQLGATTSGSFVSPLAFDGSLYGLGANALLGIHVPV